MPRRVPVVLVAGGLGAGKTSLVNHLLHHAAGTRIGVVVNDFGALGVDAMLVEGQAGSLASLAGGCLCCTTDADGLGPLLADLVAPATGLDLVVVEASGLAEPRELVRLLLAATDPHVAYGGLVLVVDARRGDTLEKAPENTPGIDLADLVVLNGTDLVDDLGTAAAALRSRTPAPVVATAFGAVDPALLVDPPASPRAGQLSFAALLREEHTHPHAAAESVAFTSDVPLHPGRLAAVLEAGPAGVVRAKGVVRFPGAAPFVVQTVGTAIRVRAAPRTATVDGAVLVLIGAGLDAAALTAALGGCRLAPGEEPSEHALLAMLRYAEPAPT